MNPLFNQKNKQAGITSANLAEMYSSSRPSEVNTDGVISKSEDSYTALRRPMENDLMKSERKGEGSRGGKIIGHTRSGKPIYDTHNHPSHKNFTANDHVDAINLHNGSHSTHANHWLDTNRKDDYHLSKMHEHSRNEHGHNIELMKKQNYAHAKYDQSNQAASKAHVHQYVDRSERVIGKTQSGKDIVSNTGGDKVSYSHYNKQDHTDAANAHWKEALKWENNKQAENYWVHDDATRSQRYHHHVSMSNNHRAVAGVMKDEAPAKDNVDIASDFRDMGVQDVSHHGTSVSIPHHQLTAENVSKINAYMDKHGHKPKITKFNDSVNLQF